MRLMFKYYQKNKLSNIAVDGTKTILTGNLQVAGNININDNQITLKQRACLIEERFYPLHFRRKKLAPERDIILTAELAGRADKDAAMKDI
jgi:hypothetical protein